MSEIAGETVRAGIGTARKLNEAGLRLTETVAGKIAEETDRLSKRSRGDDDG